MHALKCPGLTSVNFGLCFAHSSVAYRHRLLKVQPEGGLIGLGISPDKTILFLVSLCSGSGTGMAESNASVYGCNGFVKSVLVGATSTIRPKYMTAILSDIWPTTDKS